MLKYLLEFLHVYLKWDDGLAEGMLMKMFETGHLGHYKGAKLGLSKTFKGSNRFVIQQIKSHYYDQGIKAAVVVIELKSKWAHRHEMCETLYLPLVEKAALGILERTLPGHFNRVAVYGFRDEVYVNRRLAMSSLRLPVLLLSLTDKQMFAVCEAYSNDHHGSVCSKFLYNIRLSLKAKQLFYFKERIGHIKQAFNIDDSIQSFLGWLSNKINLVIKELNLNKAVKQKDKNLMGKALYINDEELVGFICGITYPEMDESSRSKLYCVATIEQVLDGNIVFDDCSHFSYGAIDSLQVLGLDEKVQ